MFGPNRKSVGCHLFWGLIGKSVLRAWRPGWRRLGDCSSLWSLLFILSLFHVLCEEKVFLILRGRCCEMPFKYIRGDPLYISWSVLQYKSSPDHSILETPPRGGDHYSILEPLDSRLSISQLFFSKAFFPCFQQDQIDPDPWSYPDPRKSAASGRVFQGIA